MRLPAAHKQHHDQQAEIPDAFVEKGCLMPLTEFIDVYGIGKKL